MGSVLFCTSSNDALPFFPSSLAHGYKWHASAQRLCCMHTDVLPWTGWQEGFAQPFSMRAPRRCCGKRSTYEPGSQRLLPGGVQVPSVCRLFCHGLERLCSLNFPQFISEKKSFSRLCSALAVSSTWNILHPLPWISHDFRKGLTRSFVAK